MSHVQAQQFLSRMREDAKFRSAVISQPDSEVQKMYLLESGFSFSTHDLVAAMAACMEEMEKMSQWKEKR